MNTSVFKPARVAIIGASGIYGKGILVRAEESVSRRWWSRGRRTSSKT